MKNLFLNKGSLLIIFWGIINIFCVACESQKYVECKEMIALVNNITKQTQAIADNSSDRDQDLENWLNASDIMKQGATNLEALAIEDSQLIEYQAKLVDIYLVYSQATYNAVKARETRNLQALQSARDDAKNVAEDNYSLVKNINNYCLEK